MDLRLCKQQSAAYRTLARPSTLRRVTSRRTCPVVVANASKLQFPSVGACGRTLSAIIAAGLISISPPAIAQIQTVPASSITDYAKPIPKPEKVPKEIIWVLFIGGAASLFGIVLAIENYAGWFPAIAKANQAISSYREMSNENEQETYTSTPSTNSPPNYYQDVPPPPASTTDAVLSGLAEARANVLKSSAPPTSSPAPAPTPPAANDHTVSPSISLASTVVLPTSTATASSTAPASAPVEGSTNGSTVGSTEGSEGSTDSEDKQWEKQLDEEMRSASKLIGMSDQQLEKYVEARRALEAFKEQSAALKEQRGG